ncbi:hypothetical protein [Prevotella nigrescens]|nr:hypothetical protein [Prevotella nigrescens]
MGCFLFLKPLSHPIDGVRSYPTRGIYLRPTRGVRLHVIRGVQTLPYLQTIAIRRTHVTTSLFRDLFVPASGNESGIDTNC